MSKIKPGDLLTLEIARSNDKGGFETIKLVAPFQLTIQSSRKSINELILPSGKWDILEMEWINGTTLGGEIKQLVEQRDSNGIRRLSEEFEKLAKKITTFL